MWSDASRAAAIEARKHGAHSNTHEGKGGNRKIAKKAKDDHNQLKSVAGGVVKGALIGSIVPGIGTIAGGVIGGVIRSAHNSNVIQNNPKVRAAIKAADAKKRKK